MGRRRDAPVREDLGHLRDAATTRRAGRTGEGADGESVREGSFDGEEDAATGDGRRSSVDRSTRGGERRRGRGEIDPAVRVAAGGRAREDERRT